MSICREQLENCKSVLTYYCQRRVTWIAQPQPRWGTPNGTTVTFTSVRAAEVMGRQRITPDWRRWKRHNDYINVVWVTSFSIKGTYWDNGWNLHYTGTGQHHVAMISLQAEYSRDWLTARNSVDNTFINVFFPFFSTTPFFLFILYCRAWKLWNVTCPEL